MKIFIPKLWEDSKRNIYFLIVEYNMEMLLGWPEERSESQTNSNNLLLPFIII
jgi:hypothetical protein